MDEEVYEKYIKAGKIARKARNKAVEMCSPGKKLEDIAEAAEKVIRDQGGKPAFPVNLSLNEEAAHYTPSKQDSRELSEGDVVKVDVGAHVDGFIGDTAETVDLGDNEELVEASAEAVEETIELAGPGISTGELGEKTEKTIKSYGFNPIRNLGGHSLGEYKQHAGLFIPNISTSSGEKLEPGNAYAIECFATDGEGKVVEGKPGNIYKYDGGNVRNRTARKILKAVKSNYRTLPFTTRWLDFSRARIKLAMKRMVDSGVVHSYDILREAGKGTVTQKEHTFVVREDGIEVTTR